MKIRCWLARVRS